MMEFALEFEDGRRILRSFELPLSIGRDEASGLRLRGWRVARHHACIMAREGEVWIEDFGSLAGTEVNGRRVALYGPLHANDEIVIGPCLLRVLGLPGASSTSCVSPASYAAGASSAFGEPSSSAPSAPSASSAPPASAAIPSFGASSASGPTLPTGSAVDTLDILKRPSGVVAEPVRVHDTVRRSGGMAEPRPPRARGSANAANPPTWGPADTANRPPGGSNDVANAPAWALADAANLPTGGPARTANSPTGGPASMASPGLDKSAGVRNPPSGGLADARNPSSDRSAGTGNPSSGRSAGMANPLSGRSAGMAKAPPGGPVDMANPAPAALAEASAPPPHSADGLALRRRLHGRLIEALQLRRRDIGLMSDEALRAEAAKVLSALIAEDEAPPQGMDREALARDLLDEAVGLGPLEALLADPEVTEIMVNRHDEIFVEVRGRLRRYPRAFSGEQAVLGVIERIVAPLGRRIDDSSPMVDARLRDGSRVNAVIAPIALRGASLTIRKFPARRLGMADLLAAGALDEHIAAFLQACVRHKKNLIVSGGTGSGKTSLLNILSNAIPDGERVVTIEDAAELRLNHRHLVSLEARPANLEGRGRIEIRDLVRNALRMRPDRIVVGECRGGEAFDMLAAMNTGHEGSLTTLHANSPRDALGRLETMILMAGMDLPLAAVREHVASSIDVIVQLARTPDGRRMVSSVVEVAGMEAGRIQTQELFRGEAGPPAVFSGCGLLPDCFARQPQVLEASLFSHRTVREVEESVIFGSTVRGNGESVAFGAAP